MKNVILAFFMLSIFGLVSCGGDDGCENDFAGTYTGTNDCSVIGSSDVTVTITGEDGDYTVDGAGITSESMDQDGCTLSFDRTPLGTGEKVTITMIDSTTIRVVREILAVGVTTETCTFEGSK